MALVVGTDTFGTLAEADDYADARPYFAEWKSTSTSDDDKEAALRMAAQQLSSMYEWKGSITDEDQLLPWPRQYVYDNEGREISSTTIPTKIKWAQFELAYQWLVADQLTPDPTSVTSSSDTPTIKREKLGGLEREYFNPDSYLYDASAGRLKTKVYPLVDMYVKPYIARKVGGIWTPSSY